MIFAWTSNYSSASSMCIAIIVNCRQRNRGCWIIAMTALCVVVPCLMLQVRNVCASWRRRHQCSDSNSRRICSRKTKPIPFILRMRLSSTVCLRQPVKPQRLQRRNRRKMDGCLPSTSLLTRPLWPTAPSANYVARCIWRRIRNVRTTIQRIISRSVNDSLTYVVRSLSC